MPSVHFIGIGGAGMSGLAEVLIERGLSVSGSDLTESEKTKELTKLGAKIFIGHKAENIPKDTDLVVYTSAIIGHNNLEFAEALTRGIKTLRRADFLGELTKDRKLIAVAGTHGKTTTTSMIAYIMLEAGLDPFVSIGAEVRELGMKNARSGAGNLAVVEADEYDRSFLSLKPFIAVLTTLEAEHLDIYKDLANLQDAFVEFANNSSQPGETGFAIVNIDEESLREILSKLNKRIVTFGIKSSEAKYRASEIHAEALGTKAVIHRGSDILGELVLKIPGEHNIKNALAAIAAAEILAIPFETSRNALSTFIGAKRRSDIIGEANGIMVIDDYAHHPTEIRATLSALKAGYPGRRIVAAFEPHTFTRTRDFAEEFGKVLAELADVLLLLDVYPAREEPIEGITSKLILEYAHDSGMKECSLIGTLDDLPKAMSAIAKKDDILVTLGAGTITEAAPKILQMIKKKDDSPQLKNTTNNRLTYREKIA
jgi:UDP-N-acetylmuramate--alanine ligase